MRGNASLAGSTILIIDDTPANLAFAVEGLEEHGYRVLVAQDGREGVTRAELMHPDLILLDVMMPGMSGIEACKLLRANAAARDIPVIFMTALTDVGSKIACFEAGGVDYLTKPLDMDEVAIRINTHLSLAKARADLKEKNRLLELEIAERQRIETELCQLFARLKENEERFRSLVELSSDAILTVQDGAVTFANHAALSLFGVSRIDEVMGRPYLSLVALPDRLAVEAILQALMPDGSCHMHDEQVLGLDGVITDVTVTRVAFSHLGKTMIQVVLHDISKRVQLIQQLQYQATHDPLTGLPNRTLLLDRMQQMINLGKRQQERFKVCFVDVDRFKWINDTYGHDAGDEVLRSVSRKISTMLRKTDTLARIGGDEFVLILQESGMEDESTLVLSRIAGVIAEPIWFAGNEIKISCSVGCCSFPEDGQNVEELLHFADAAMYRAKKTQQPRARELEAFFWYETPGAERHGQ